MDKLTKRFSGVFFGAVFYITAIFIVSVTAYYMDFPDETLKAASYAITITGILISSVIAGKRSDKKGWLYGLLGGGIFMAVVCIISIIIAGGINTGRLLRMMPIYIFAATVGGIMGINVK